MNLQGNNKRIDLRPTLEQKLVRANGEPDALRIKLAEERVPDDVDLRIIKCIERISNDDGCVLLADLSKAFPLPYPKLYYRIKALARNGDIRICHRGRSIVCRAPVWTCNRM
jgi:uncharacterized membrane protein